MKILFIRSLNPYFESTASGNRYTGILNGLLKNGVKVKLIVTGGYNHFDEYKLKNKYTENENFEVKYLVPIFNHTIWLRRINVYLLAGILQMLINIKLKKYFKADYDFVWLTFEKKILSSFCENQPYLNAKSIIELNEYNDLYINDITRGNSLQQKKEEVENQVFTKALKNIDLLAVMTKTLINHYKPLAKPGVKVFHMPMTVDISRFENIKNTEVSLIKPYIAYTGSFTNQKDGIDILIQAFAQIASKYSKYRLYLAGFYDYDVDSQIKLIETLKLNERIIYLNVLAKAEIPSFITNAGLLVMARPDSRQARGGFPTKLGEYLATGNPVCVTKVGEIPEYLKDNESAFLAEPGNIDSFANAMDRALSHIENAKRIGINGRKVAEKYFDIDVQAERLMTFLKNNI